MDIERTRHGPWDDAWTIRRGELELALVTRIGPRIMSFRHAGGPNLLFEDPRGVHRGAWRFYGGSRFWVSPETESAYHPENAPCEVATAPDAITVTMPAEPSGLQRAMTIRAAAAHAGFEIEYRLANVGEMLARGGAWVLTCALGPGRLICPWNEGTEAWATQMVRYWRRWSTFGTDVASPQWHPDNGVFWIEPSGETGKVGLYSAQGLLALVRADGTFIKQADPVPWATYPDGGCNLEICTTPDFIEMETLSPLVDLAPGQALVHREQWLFTRDRFEPQDWRRLPALVGRP